MENVPKNWVMNSTVQSRTHNRFTENIALLEDLSICKMYKNIEATNNTVELITRHPNLVNPNSPLISSGFASSFQSYS
jgi:hypothetical protein